MNPKVSKIERDEGAAAMPPEAARSPRRRAAGRRRRGRRAARAPAEAAPTRRRFTVRNEILHGPVLWPVGSRYRAREFAPGARRGDSARRSWRSSAPTSRCAVSTRVGFFGGGTTTFSGDGAHDQARGRRRARVAGTTFKLDIGYSAISTTFDAEWQLADASRCRTRDVPAPARR